MADILNFIILVSVTIIIMGALISPMADFFIRANSSGDGGTGNVTGAMYSLSVLVPLLFIVAVILIIWANSKKK